MLQRIRNSAKPLVEELEDEYQSQTLNIVNNEITMFEDEDEYNPPLLSRYSPPKNRLIERSQSESSSDLSSEDDAKAQLFKKLQAIKQKKAALGPPERVKREPKTLNKAVNNVVSAPSVYVAPKRPPRTPAVACKAPGRVKKHDPVSLFQ